MQHWQSNDHLMTKETFCVSSHDSIHCEEDPLLILTESAALELTQSSPPSQVNFHYESPRITICFLRSGRHGRNMRAIGSFRVCWHECLSKCSNPAFAAMWAKSAKMCKGGRVGVSHCSNLEHTNETSPNNPESEELPCVRDEEISSREQDR